MFLGVAQGIVTVFLQFQLWTIILEPYLSLTFLNIIVRLVPDENMRPKFNSYYWSFYPDYNRFFTEVFWLRDGAWRSYMAAKNPIRWRGCGVGRVSRGIRVCCVECEVFKLRSVWRCRSISLFHRLWLCRRVRARDNTTSSDDNRPTRKLFIDLLCPYNEWCVTSTRDS